MTIEESIKAEDAVADNDTVLNFRSALSEFRFSRASHEGPLRCSQRQRRPTMKCESEYYVPDGGDGSGNDDDDDVLPAPRKTSRKRSASQASNTRVKQEVGASPKKKPKRGYAPPETYAHLAALNDYLVPGLDVVFCGINPGYMSAEKGHHFCNPTNHFYRCLHASGFTPTRIPPTEDHTLPERFNLGLTNLVERPSTEAGELSPAEMAASVPALLAKIARVRPRIVCFVGIGIARVVLRALRGQAVPAPASASAPASPPPPHTQSPGSRLALGLVEDATVVERQDAPPFTSPRTAGADARKDARAGAPTPTSTPAKAKARSAAALSPDVGLQPFKLVYRPPPSEAIRETLFSVCPSTSGRVTHFQATDKERIFRDLKDALEKLKAGALDTSRMAVIDVGLVKAEY